MQLHDILLLRTSAILPEAISAGGLMDEDEYKMWLEDTLKLFNVPIEDFV